MTKAKSLHIVVNTFYPVTAGTETNILETYSVLVKIGWSVVVHTSKNTLTERGILPETEIVRGIKIIRYSVKRILSFLPKLDWQKTDVVALHNFDTVPHFYIFLYVLLLKILKRKKFVFVFTPHGGFNPEWSIFSRMQAFIRRLYYPTLGVFLINNAVDGIRTVSEWEKKEMIRMGINSSFIKTINNGIENEAYLDVDRKASQEIRRLVKTWGQYIVQIGRINKEKNYETTIKALSKIPSDVKFIIVGPIQDEKYKLYLDSIIGKMGLKNRVVFPGVIRGIDKYYLLKYASVMVHMSIRESFCNAVHEGMSQGLVCIVANNTALPYLIKDEVNGYCLPTYDANAVAEKINFVLENKNSRAIKKMQARNKQYTLGNSWKSVAERMENFYLRILSQRRGAL